ncbi:valine--tRNA ligase [Candidatus Paracaedibacter symbiosus]|uniref:valine--tRNA ligase n=1 Tax=Candidatus Paracaedibacter symbiosus TaxID=244582 RepID=UPI0005096652
MLDKHFTPQTVEGPLYEKWEASGLFACDPHSLKPAYTIMMPPPNVTGTLHVGHALTYTLQDVLIRFKRMCGYDVLWQPGTDHAGIATQMVVERQLEAQGVSRHDLGRDKFVEKVWEWKEYSGNTIVEQQRRLGITPDWSRQRFTLDEGLSHAVRKVFVELYNQGLIYRDKRLVNWDSKLQTAVSDLEALSQEVKGHLWYIAYPLADNPSESIVVATTRPETMLGDMAVAVHPEDERYQHLVGKMVKLPLTDRQIPIIADEYCDREKGSGAVKMTPAHDFNDFEVCKRHNIPMLSILDFKAHMNENVPEAYRGLSVEAARKRVLEDLEAQQLLVKIEPIIHAQPFSERSGVLIQPLLTDQWFVDAYTLAQPAIKAVEDGTTRFVPDHWNSTYFEWLRNIQPWCISRQIWWGHQIPAWFGPDQKIFVAETESQAHEQAMRHYGHQVELVQETDVLDTWFSSALWPFSTLGWPEETVELKRYYPTDVLDTGFDIIFFWVARMMMMGLHFTGQVPFKTVYIHALVRDEKGAKMSKSKGNVLDPLTLSDEYGCDALRYTLASLAVPGRDLKLGESRIQGSRNFMTKLWNAARFLEMNACVYQKAFDALTAKLPVNRWIVSEFATLTSKVYRAIEAYRFDEAAADLYKFLWGTYCDFYLEFLKPIFANVEEAKALQESRATASWILMEFMKIANPIIPFVTETLWEQCGGEGLLMAVEWPIYGREAVDARYVDVSAQEEMNWLVELVSAIRSRRTEFNVPPGMPIPLQIFEATPELEARVKRHEIIIKRLAKISELSVGVGQSENLKGVIQFVLGAATIILPLGQSIDLEAEKQRLHKEMQKVQTELETGLKRLSNMDFMAKARQEVIDELKERVSNLEVTIEKIKDALLRIA